MSAKTATALAVLFVTVAFATPVVAQQRLDRGNGIADAERAGGEYGFGVRELADAKKENNPTKKAALYIEAKDHFLRALQLRSHYSDVYLPLGQVYLGLGDKPNAKWACAQALPIGGKTTDQALACLTAAGARVERR